MTFLTDINGKPATFNVVRDSLVMHIDGVDVDCSTLHDAPIETSKAIDKAWAALLCPHCNGGCHESPYLKTNACIKAGF